MKETLQQSKQACTKAAKKTGFICLQVTAVGIMFGASAVFIGGMAAMDVYHKVRNKLRF